jgi:hypothetical protein
VRINEIRTDQNGVDDDEYFELAGPSGEPLNDLTYLVIGDGPGGSGVIEEAQGLTGESIPPDGFFLAVEGTFTIGGGQASADLNTGVNGLNFENDDNVTHLLVRDFTGMDGQDLDTNDDGVLDILPWSEVVDSIALVLSPNPPVGTEFTYGANAIGPDGGVVPKHVFRCPDQSGAWQIGIFDPIEVDDTPGSANDCMDEPIPTASEGGMVAMMVLLVVAGAVVMRVRGAARLRSLEGEGNLRGPLT